MNMPRVSRNDPLSLPDIIRLSTWRTSELRESAAKLVEVILDECAAPETLWLLERIDAADPDRMRHVFWTGGVGWTPSALDAARFPCKRLAEEAVVAHWPPQEREENPIVVCGHTFGCGTSPLIAVASEKQTTNAAPAERLMFGCTNCGHINDQRLDDAIPSSDLPQEPKPVAFELPYLDGPTPCTDQLVNEKLGRMVALDPAYHYAQAIIDHAKALERLFWRERKSSHGLTGLLGVARSATSPSNWIPVSERRPTLADCTTFDGLPVLLVLWDGKNPGCPVFDDSRGLPASITHWMRLPSHGQSEGRDA